MIYYFLQILIFFVRMFCPYVYNYTTCIPSAFGGLKRAWNSLELELQVGVSCHIGSGN